jgi:hypothetical protein
MNSGPCWGFQLGGIPATRPDDDPQMPTDFEDRVKEFLHRHGDQLPSTRTEGALDHGLRGWMEIQSRDGYVLRIEWSKSALRSAFVATERGP